MFSIQSISCRTITETFGGHKWSVDVVVTIPIGVWNKYKKNMQLGFLYGTYLSNAVYKINNAIPAYNPIVDDTKRAKLGTKTIQLRYYISDARIAEALGMSVTYLSNGEYLSKFAEYKTLA